MSGHVSMHESPQPRRPSNIVVHVDEESAIHKGAYSTAIEASHLSATSPTSGQGSSKKRLNRLSRLGQLSHLAETEDVMIRFWDRFTRKGKKNVSVGESFRAIFLSSWLNVFLIFIPLAWVSHFLHWPQRVTFTLSFLAIIPLERLFEYGGEQMCFYLGKDLGDLLTITLNNAVEATLAIILLTYCELTLLKSTIIGVVILHLLLVPGTAFIAGGARIIEQDLHPHLTELNHSLLTLGMLSVMLPAAFFAALASNFNPAGATGSTSLILTDELRGNFLKMSRGIAFCLLFIYVCSRVYLHNPPGEDNALALHLHPQAPEGLKQEARHLQEGEPQVNQYICVAMLAICIGIMAATAEWLVKALEFVREGSNIQAEWFGLILLPIVSYAADGTVAIVYFIRYLFRHFFRAPTPPTTLAKGRAIDLSIQFTLFWMPFFVLLGWWTGRPMSLLFDLFEVAILIGSCFIVNYVTADSKTNWAEGATMVSFYVMIAVCAWFYPGQPEIGVMSECASVSDSLAALASGEVTGSH